MGDEQNQANYLTGITPDSSLPSTGINNSPDAIAPAPKSRRWLFPAFMIVVAIAVAGVVLLFGLENGSKDDVSKESKDDSSVVSEDSDVCPTKKASFDEMTKKDAYDWLVAISKNTNCAIHNIVGNDEINLPKKSDQLYLLYSYGDTSEIQSIANDSIMNSKKYSGEVVDFTVEQKEHYAVVYDKTRKSCEKKYGGNCYVGITFDKNYVNYREVTETVGRGESVSYPTTYVNTDEKWLKLALDIVQATGSYLRSTYETTLDFDGEKYVYVTRNLGVGVDMENLEQFYEDQVVPYSINVYETKSTIDPLTGEKITLRNSADSGHMEVIKRFPLTEKEVTSLFIP